MNVTCDVHTLDPSTSVSHVGDDGVPSVPPDGLKTSNVRRSPLASMPRIVTVVGPLAPAMATLTAAGAGSRTTTVADWALLRPSETE